MSTHALLDAIHKIPELEIGSYFPATGENEMTQAAPDEDYGLPPEPIYEICVMYAPAEEREALII